LKKLEENRAQKSKEEENNYEDRLNEIAKKYPKIPTLIVPEDEIDEVLNENYKIKMKRLHGQEYLEKMYEYDKYIKDLKLTKPSQKKKYQLQDEILSKKSPFAR
jgi:hypothetical protein